jgi:hypothetical protein
MTEAIERVPKSIARFVRDIAHRGLELRFQPSLPTHWAEVSFHLTGFECLTNSNRKSKRPERAGLRLISYA